MIVVGIKYVGHDSAAAIVVDGKVMAASSQERFDRKKHSKAFPMDAIRWCLQSANLSTIAAVDHIAVQYDFSQAYRRYDGDLWKHLGLDVLKPFLQNLYDDIRKYLVTLYKIRFVLKYAGPISFLDHHDCHAASAFYTSPFPSAAVLTVDGRGESSTTRLYAADSNGLRSISTIRFPHSLGFYYSKITAYLGYRSDSEEGTVMGLAGFGDHANDAKIRQLITLGPGFDFKLDLSYFSYHKDMAADVSSKFQEHFGPRRKKGAALREHHRSVAHGMQERLAEAMSYLCRQAYLQTGADFLCLAGGIALNASANGKLMEELPFKNIYVQPAAGDDGSALGAALLQYYLSTGKAYEPVRYWPPYQGYEAAPAEIEAALEKAETEYYPVKDPARTAARLLAAGNVVAWYQGRAEFGPRALGNRCILAAPYPVSMKDKVNQIKRRESFRPFAPAVLLEEMPKYFRYWRPSPYMTFAYPVTDHAKETIPAVVHIDGTARVQTVEKSQNEKFFLLLKSFQEQTGLGVVLSTSLNGPGEPLVNSPSEAVNLFKTTEIDAIVLDHYVAMKPECKTRYKDLLD